MTGCSCVDLQQLKRKVEQHEKTISQLIDIISVTNGRVTDIVAKQNNHQERISHT